VVVVVVVVVVADLERGRRVQQTPRHRGTEAPRHRGTAARRGSVSLRDADVGGVHEEVISLLASKRRDSCGPSNSDKKDGL